MTVGVIRSSMTGVSAHRGKGLTLIEVMVSLLIILIIVIGVITYMYATAKNAKEADVRATAGRIALLLLESWKANGAVVSSFDPANSSENINVLPLSDFGSPGALNLNTAAGFNLLKSIRIQADNVKYFAELTYNNTSAPYKLCVYIAWNKGNYSSSTLGSNANVVALTDYAYLY